MRTTTVFKRNKKWQVGLWDKAAKKNVYRTLPESVKSKKEAQQTCAELQAKLDRKSLGLETASSQTSGNGWLDVAADILNEVERECTKDWLSNCQSFVKRFHASVGDCPAAQVTTQQCRRYRTARLRQGANQTTLRKEILFLARVFQRAVDDELILRNPWNGVKRGQEERHPPRYLSPEELEKILAVAPPHRQFRYLFLAYTGVRRGEAWKVRWRDLNFEQRQILINNAKKGCVPRYPYRTVPIPDLLFKILTERRGEPDQLLFPTRRNWLRDLKLDAKKAGLSRKVRIHDLRHTCGSWLAQSGEVTLQEIRDLLSHKRLSTTEQYAHLLPNQHQNVLRAFQNVGANSETQGEQNRKQ